MGASPAEANPGQKLDPMKTLMGGPPSGMHTPAGAPPPRPPSAKPAPPVERPPAPAPPRSPPAASPAAAYVKPAPEGDPFIGRTLNSRYEVISKLGEGGFGAVYRGKQLHVGREVAIKVLNPSTQRDPNLVARFKREGAVACNLRDPHTITTFDFDQTPEGLLYIAMELLQGESLHDVFSRHGRLEWKRVLRILDMMCSSLAEAHSLGIVHRDLKPENIFLEDRPGHGEFVKVLDFGIAKIVGGEIGQNSPQLTATGQTLGTLEYMSPEQLMGRELDGRSDVYALGVLAYELTTGQLPFPDATGPAALIAAQLRKVPAPPSRVDASLGLPSAFDALVARMLDKDLAKRVQSAADLRTDIRRVLEPGAETARPETPAPRPVKQDCTQRVEPLQQTRAPGYSVGDSTDLVYPPPSRTRLYVIAAAVGLVLTALALYAILT